MSPPAAIDEVPSAAPATNGGVTDGPMKLEDIYSRRKKTDKSQWGTAAPSRSENFKVYTHSHKPKAKRWDGKFSTESLSRVSARLKGAAVYLGRPGMISLGGGLPSSEYFPFDDLSFKTPGSGHFDDADSSAWDTVTSGKNDMAAGKSNYDIATAFNYHQGSGSAQLLRWITEHTEIVHNPPYADWAVTQTVGSTSALDMSLRMLTRPGDYVVSDEYAFSSAMDTAAPLGVKFAGVKMDAEGMLAADLDQVLSNWDPATRNGARKPHVLYLVPTGQNPTGATQSAQRRREVYQVAQKHDLLILEDEPYYFLQMDPYVSGGDKPEPPKSHEEFLAAVVPSLLSMDTDGRVIRMDSFSKVVAPGSRVGWITASEQIVERYSRHADVSTQGPSGMSQLMLFKLLEEHWGHPGYIDWLIHIRKEYTERRNIIVGACEKHLPREIVSWNPPMAGMFHWMEVDWRKHPHASTKSITELEEEIFLSAVDKGALVIRGSWFYAEPDAAHDKMFFRASFAAAPADKIQEAIRRFGEALRESFQL
ncbi:putative amino transferase protein [Lasiodiplodia theobromae]|uniref:aromatic-amino-acid transaminase n=1 Tax=Lasiodiplodia theobromae TaxID=45133 RepID=A0A5N5DLN9_9PEZI|nr:Aromatic amino acid aminotransferase 1 [Lasiodiplodia theobromae]KAB2577764.1 Aromatic amino acid aminotransferase [Lasiodiplodia theobromae]KAF4538432.1 Aromatic amino acid aminotransferase 1 [Lasiodiplodia theobromae]KAF9633533.1 putative amino transferase protein [Lasiodiplodia theobromae]